MEDNTEREIEEWAATHDLTRDTLRVLREEGFSSMKMLRRLTPEEVADSFQRPRLLPVAQCLALKEAVMDLAGETTPVKSTTQKGDVTFSKEMNGHSDAAGPSGHSSRGSQPASRPVFGNPQSFSSSSQPVPRPVFEETHLFPSSRQNVNRPAFVDHQQDGPSSNQAANRPVFGDHSSFDSCNQAVGRPSCSESSPRIFCTETSADSYYHRDLRALEQAGATRMPRVTGETFRFLLVGKTGAGKSTTGNTILGDECFTSDVTFESVTDICELKRNTRHGVTLEIIDSPGLFDTSRSLEAIGKAIVRAVACMHPGPHAFLYVVKIGQRFTEEEAGVFERLVALFDETLSQYTVVVFTGGDGLEAAGRSINEVLASAPAPLRQIMAAVQNRYVVFNNVADNKEPQVLRLLQVIRAMVAQNGGQPYSCSKYGEVGTAMEEEVERRLADLEKRHLQRKPYVQQLEAQTRQAETALNMEREEFQRKEREREEEMRQREAKREADLQNLRQQLEQQQVSEEQRRHEMDAMRQQFEMERERQVREMEEQRERDLENLQRRENEMTAMMNRMMEERRAEWEERDRAREEEMRRLREGMARDNEPGLLDRMVGAVGKFIQLFSGLKDLKKMMGFKSSEKKKAADAKSHTNPPEYE